MKCFNTRDIEANLTYHYLLNTVNDSLGVHFIYSNNFTVITGYYFKESLYIENAALNVKFFLKKLLNLYFAENQLITFIFVN
ncbi:MAG: hypothetical protein WBO31_02750 [Saprospiraceae bacterium]